MPLSFSIIKCFKIAFKIDTNCVCEPFWDDVDVVKVGNCKYTILEFLIERRLAQSGRKGIIV